MTAAFDRVAARDKFVRAHGGHWRTAAVFERGDSALLQAESSSVVVGSGDVGEVVALVRDHAATLGEVRHAFLPYGTREAYPGVVEDALGLEAGGAWEWLWCRTPAPVQPGEEFVRPLEGIPAEDLVQVSAEANPAATTRPGDPGLVWWGYQRDGAVLGLCALSLPELGSDDHGLHLSGLGVLPAARRQGVGAAMMAAITRWGIAQYGLVHYGVWMDNEAALRVYRRLGYTTGAWVQGYRRR